MYPLSNPEVIDIKLLAEVVARQDNICTGHILDKVLVSHKSKTIQTKTNLEAINRITTTSSLITILVRIGHNGRCLLFNTTYVWVLDSDSWIINDFICTGILPDVSCIKRLHLSCL